MYSLLKRPEVSLGWASAATQRTVFAARAALNGNRRGLRALLPFAGPAVVASVSYMDPGNFATNIQAGSAYGYELLWVVVVASAIAMFFQAMSAKLGIVTGKNLAELCRQEFPRPVMFAMWIASEVAAMATDLAEFLGGALGLSLLLHVSLLLGLVLTGVITLLILGFEKNGFRPIEMVTAALVGVIGVSYLGELAIAPADWTAVLVHSVVPEIRDCHAVTLAVGIIGATIMPHTLYLHSSLTQNRTVPRNDAERRLLIRFSNREVLIALGFAALVNLAMVVMSASEFSRSAPGLSDIAVAYRTLIPAFGMGAAVLFVISLATSGVSSSVVGTMAGQVIMQGFVGFRVPVWVRRLLTMAPAFGVALCCNTMTAMVLSQVVLSFVLPLPMIALVILSSRRSVMGDFVMARRGRWAAISATAAIVLLNGILLLYAAT